MIYKWWQRPGSASLWQIVRQPSFRNTWPKKLPHPLAWLRDSASDWNEIQVVAKTRECLAVTNCMTECDNASHVHCPSKDSEMFNFWGYLSHNWKKQTCLLANYYKETKMFHGKTRSASVHLLCKHRHKNMLVHILADAQTRLRPHNPQKTESHPNTYITCTHRHTRINLHIFHQVWFVFFRNCNYPWGNI